MKSNFWTCFKQILVEINNIYILDLSLDSLNFEDGADSLFRNVVLQLPPYESNKPEERKSRSFLQIYITQTLRNPKVGYFNFMQNKFADLLDGG